MKCQLLSFFKDIKKNLKKNMVPSSLPWSSYYNLPYIRRLNTSPTWYLHNLHRYTYKVIMSAPQHFPDLQVRPPTYIVTHLFRKVDDIPLLLPQHTGSYAWDQQEMCNPDRKPATAPESESESWNQNPNPPVKNLLGFPKNFNSPDFLLECETLYPLLKIYSYICIVLIVWFF